MCVSSSTTCFLSSNGRSGFCKSSDNQRQPRSKRNTHNFLQTTLYQSEVSCLFNIFLPITLQTGAKGLLFIQQDVTNKNLTRIVQQQSSVLGVKNISGCHLKLLWTKYKAAYRSKCSFYSSGKACRIHISFLGSLSQKGMSSEVP